MNNKSFSKFIGLVFVLSLLITACSKEAIKEPEPAFEGGKIYENNDDGYVLTVPEDWVIYDDSNSHHVIIKNNSALGGSDTVRLNIDIVENDSKASLSGFPKKIKIDGIEANQYVFAAGPNIAYVVHILKDNKVFEISYTVTNFSKKEVLEKLENVYSEIINSFDFTK